MRRAQASILVEQAERDFDLFCDPSGAAFASTLTEPMETLRLDGGAFGRSLRRTFFRDRDDAPSDASLSSALAILEAIAEAEGAEHEVFMRVGRLGGSIHLDLADPAGRTVAIGHGRWKVVEGSPLRFLRPPGMLALPEPLPGGSLDELPGFINLPDEDSLRLVVGFLLASLNPAGPFPLLALDGEQGSAKTTAAVFLRSLIDPSSSALRSPPKDLRDLAVATRGAWVLAFDNLSHVPQDLSDALCRLSTGGAFATRRLYTDAEEIAFEARRPVIVTSIPEVVTSSDLADRTFAVTLEAIAESERMSEAELRAAFAEARPRLLGALCDALACGLANLGRITLDGMPRMADAALLVTAAEPALGWEPGSFLAALDANRAEASASALDGSLVGRPLVAIARAGGFTGTASALLSRLGIEAGPEATRDHNWPKTPRALSSRLTRLRPDLERMGITVERSRTGHAGDRTITIAMATPGGDAPSDGTVVPFAKPQAPSPMVEQAVAALRAVGVDVTWGSSKIASVALLKAAGNTAVAVEALNVLGIPGPGGSRWTVDALQGVV